MTCPGFVYRSALLAILLMPLTVVQAEGLYRWFDSEGQPHFSDRPPGGPYEADRLRMPSYVPPALPPDQDPYSILNQAKRLEAQREAIARERQERLEKEREYRLRQREIELQQQAQLAPPPPRVIVYPRRHHRPLPVHPPRWPDYQRPNFGLWKPEHPAYRP